MPLRLLCTLLLLSLMPALGSAQEKLAFWNVENLFDTYDDTLTYDDEFTPDGTKHWTHSRYKKKLLDVSKTIIEMDVPVVIGLAEVENDRVLDDLIYGTPLRKFLYGYIHYDSPDPRGIDCALLYRKSVFSPLWSYPVAVYDSVRHKPSRDMLLVAGTLPTGDTLIVVVCHLPSKLGGADSDRWRYSVAQSLRDTMAALHLRYRNAMLVAMGDFNAESHEPSMSQAMGFGDDGVNDDGLTDLMAFADGGSYCYHNRWQFIDHFLWQKRENMPVPCAEAFNAPHLFADIKSFYGSKPFRTYQLDYYVGGVSDHLPVIMSLPQR